MYYCWITIIFVFFPCNAQEHLTCLRTDDVINSSPRTTTANVQQGRPGRRGPQGPKGDSVKGEPGMKGEPGIPDHSLIESLRDDITRALQRGFMELDDGWITPFNGYQYKVNNNRLTWNDSRSVCQSWGGDLIVHGFRDHSLRVTIQRAFRLNNFYWIGLNDKQIEGNWQWVNGDLARLDDATLWRPDQPSNSGGNQDCADAPFGDFVDQFFANDRSCTSGRIRSICEKLI